METSFETTLNLEGFALQVQVWGWYTAPTPERRYYVNGDGYPSTPPQFEVLRVCVSSGLKNELDITELITSLGMEEFLEAVFFEINEPF